MDGVTPVSLAFGECGLMVTSIKDGKPFVRTLTWKELYKIGLKGKLLDRSSFLKKVTERAERVVKANQESVANHEKFMKQMKGLRRPLAAAP